jgi:hypothetical protein
MTQSRRPELPDSEVPLPGTTDWADSARLLKRVMGDARFDDAGYLNWLYNESPIGRTVGVNLRDDEGTLYTHGAAVPQELRNADGPARFVLIVNVAVLPTHRGDNTFARAVIEHIPYVLEQGGIGGYGVTNERSSTPAMSLEGLGGTLVGPLPVQLCLPTRVFPRQVETHEITAEFLESKHFVELAGELDDHPATDWTQRWSPDLLRWRLRRPDTRYALHASPNVVAISGRATVKGVPVATLLKLLPRGGSRGPLPSRELVAAACRHHGAPLAMYGGYNAHVPVSGVAIPRAWLPTPLNVVFVTLSELDPTVFRFDTLEFLDFDAL